MKIPDDIRRYVRKRRVLRVTLWLLCMGLFSLAFFSSWDSISESVYTEIRVVIFIIVLVVSIFIFRIPKLFFEKTFIGKIVWLEMIHTTESDMPSKPTMESLYKRVWINAVIELENGKRIHKEIASKRTQRLSVPSKFQRGIVGNFLANQYCVGDTVVFISGTKFCQVYSEEKESLICVVCGEFSSSDSKKCEHCGHTILRG